MTENFDLTSAAAGEIPTEQMTSRSSLDLKCELQYQPSFLYNKLQYIVS